MHVRYHKKLSNDVKWWNWCETTENSLVIITLMTHPRCQIWLERWGSFYECPVLSCLNQAVRNINLEIIFLWIMKNHHLKRENEASNVTYPMSELQLLLFCSNSSRASHRLWLFKGKLSFKCSLSLTFSFHKSGLDIMNWQRVLFTTCLRNLAGDE